MIAVLRTVGEPLRTDQRLTEALTRAYMFADSTASAEIDRVLNEAGVICGPIYTIADIFEDPQYRARGMLLEHEDPEFGRYIGPGIVPNESTSRSMSSADAGRYARAAKAAQRAVARAELDVHPEAIDLAVEQDGGAEGGGGHLRSNPATAGKTDRQLMDYFFGRWNEIALTVESGSTCARSSRQASVRTSASTAACGGSSVW